MRVKKFVLLSSVCAASAFSQSLAEHAAAVAGGSIGSAAGKPVSDAITHIFGNVEKTTAKAASAPAPTKAAAPSNSSQPEVPELPTVAPAGGSTLVRHASTGPRVLNAGLTPSPAIAAAETPRPAPKLGQPSADELRAIATGTPRGELMARLGLPSSRISIPDDSGLLEIYRYSGVNGLAGSVRLENGLVVAVQVDGTR
ncbi:MAG: hypothetical protein M3O35_06345 [Acidobacteriota bacterium]|nr:hypothetical protein [Acidobacteriota bacterium]